MYTNIIHICAFLLDMYYIGEAIRRPKQITFMFRKQIVLV